MSPTHAPEEPIDPAPLDLDSVMAISVDDVIDQLISECAAGSLDSCGYLIDQLTAECTDGYGLSCDILYWASPAGSDYELYGATCGGRFEWDYAAGACDAL